MDADSPEPSTGQPQADRGTAVAEHCVILVVGIPLLAFGLVLFYTGVGNLTFAPWWSDPIDKATIHERGWSEVIAAAVAGLPGLAMVVRSTRGLWPRQRLPGG